MLAGKQDLVLARGQALKKIAMKLLQKGIN